MASRLNCREHVIPAQTDHLEMCRLLQGGARGSDGEWKMEQLVPIFVVFALGFGVGYGVREWKSQMRRRRHSGSLF